MFEVYVLRVALAAHNVAHFSSDCEFDADKFSDRLKVRLYNSKRNVDRRAKQKDTDTIVPQQRSGSVLQEESRSAPRNSPKKPMDSVPAPTAPGDKTQELIAAEVVGQCLESATNAGASFACNIRLIRSAVFRRDPTGRNVPLQNALRSLLKGVRSNDVQETKAALEALREDVNLGANM